MPDWHVYVVRAADDSLYTGIATDVARRFEEHRNGGPRAARYLRGRGPLELIHQSRVGEKGLALRVERRLKRLSKERKEALVASSPDAEELLALLGVERGVFILHIADSTDWEASILPGFYQGPTLASEGFVHCSTTEQVVSVADRLFWGRQDLVLLVIDPRRLSAEVRPENLEGGSELYPHIYGPIERDAVVRTVLFRPGPDGRFTLPEGAR